MQNTTDRPELEALKARYVFPATGEPIPDGLVAIQGRTIVAVGPDTPTSNVRDLGNVAILPGLVNAHTHLEFSDLAEPLGNPRTAIVDWLRLVIELRGRGVKDRLGVVENGLRESTACGTTALGDISQPDWWLAAERSEAPGHRKLGRRCALPQPRNLQDAGLEATVFLELIAPTAERVGPALKLARQFFEKVVAADVAHDWRVGVSPHAPYSVHPELLWAVVRMSAAERFPIAMHVAESREEIELLRRRKGPFPDFLRELGAWDPSNFPPDRRPLDYLEALAQAHRAVVIHGNYLDDEEIAFLAAHAKRMAVVYCPRTHAFFAHAAYPLAKLLSAGATVALGTDSRASSPDLSLLAEMRFVARKHPSISPDTVLRLGTIHGAQALGRDHRLGSLEAGKYADLAVVALPGRDAADPHELLFDSDLPVVATWYRGKKGMKDE